MTDIARLDGKLQRGLGKAANKIGQTYDVRRLNNATSIAIQSNRPVRVGFPARIRRITQKVAIENAVFDLLAFVVTCDNRNLVIGDVLTETGYESESGDVFTFAQARPMSETIFMRTEFACNITRGQPYGGAASQQPSSGAVAATGYGGVSKFNEETLTLTNGLYSFSSMQGSTPASVQCGLQQLNRVRDGKSLGTPTDFYRTHFLLYAPLLPGEMLSEQDRIYFPNADRYEVMSVYSSDTTGLSGYVCVVEKLP